LGQALILVPSILATTLFPLVAGGKKEEVHKALKILTRLLLTGIGSICLFLAVLGKWLFPLIFGQSFVQMNALFLLLIPGIMALTAHYPLTAYYSGKKMIPVNIRGSLLALVIIVIADVIFIPRAGVKAASLISSIGYIVYYLYVLFIFKKEYHTSVADFFLIKKTDFIWAKNIISWIRK
jgi:O-antigen/teichoic acid export membrane protein